MIALVAGLRSAGYHNSRCLLHDNQPGTLVRGFWRRREGRVRTKRGAGLLRVRVL